MKTFYNRTYVAQVVVYKTPYFKQIYHLSYKMQTERSFLTKQSTTNSTNVIRREQNI